MDKRKTIFIAGDTRTYYMCKRCNGAKMILDYDRPHLSHLEKCKCKTVHYTQVVSESEIPFYNPLESLIYGRE